MSIQVHIPAPTRFVLAGHMHADTVPLMTVGTLPVTRTCSLPLNKPICDRLPVKAGGVRS